MSIFNHKKRLASADYVIINPLGVVDCLDLEKCVIERDDGEVVEVEEITLSRRKIDAKKAIFRPREDPNVYIARQDWLKRIQDLGLKHSNVFGTQLEISD